MNEIGKTASVNIGGENKVFGTESLNPIKGFGGDLGEDITKKIGEVIKTKVIGSEFSDSMKALTCITTDLSGNTEIGADARSIMSIKNFVLGKQG